MGDPVELLRLIERIPTIVNSSGTAPDGMHHDRALSLLRAAADLLVSGDWVEFGVARGDSARLMVDLLPENARLHLFDSFQGLPQDWIGSFKKGHFAMPDEQIPVFDDPRVIVNKGLFADTVPGYFGGQPPLGLVHIDCDLYDSTWEALAGITPALQPGTVILFDDYYFADGSELSLDEHQAFTEWKEVTGIRCKYLWRTAWCQVAVRVVAI